MSIIGKCIGFTGSLTIISIVLKLTHIINWSWWWVLAPLWTPTIISIIILIGLLTLIHFLYKDNH